MAALLAALPHSTWRQLRPGRCRRGRPSGHTIASRAMIRAASRSGRTSWAVKDGSSRPVLSRVVRTCRLRFGASSVGANSQSGYSIAARRQYTVRAAWLRLIGATAQIRACHVSWTPDVDVARVHFRVTPFGDSPVHRVVRPRDEAVQRHGHMPDQGTHSCEDSQDSMRSIARGHT